MNLRSRSVSGIALMLVLIPMFAGILACMPVPIGDPERSKIDPDLTGIWAALADGGSADEAAFYIFERYDKRTWLITGIHMDSGADADLAHYDLTSYDGFADLAANSSVGENNIYVDRMVLYKSWLKKLGGETFMTWEPKVMLDDGIPEPEVWFVYRIVKEKSDRLRLRWLDGESALFRDVDRTRRAYERVIRKNVDDADLYYESDDGFEDMILVRVQDTELEFVETLLGSIVDWD